jgi:hypothetical protein
VAALAQEAQFQRRRVGHVDDARGVERSAVVCARSPARRCRYWSRAHTRESAGRVGRRHLVHVVDLARRSALAVEFLAIPAARALLGERLVVGDRRVGLAEDDVGRLERVEYGSLRTSASGTSRRRRGLSPGPSSL